MNPPIVVTENYIEINGETSIGILVISNGVSIVSNLIRSGGGKKARAILHFNSKAKIVHNKIEGTGSAGILLTPWKNFSANQNIFIKNEFAEFNALSADIFLGSSNNLVIGDTDKIMNKTNINLILQ
jgi:hypothetical protein